jgi:hypothetical protein
MNGGIKRSIAFNHCPDIVRTGYLLGEELPDIPPQN